ncbi:membrane protein [Rhodanobacter sp. K2T2]|uniref:YihY/virulence factor BrkB family protein n=1 Tax=Rhodanobacter sp. K2T2 TaxID=2723085 RepID=UPI0015C9E28F|nr:YihY/virulence factor BrkB family protein [Rhodanobacter sp. K2T2]NYE27123.1 membrane protein [Rhodanobacter sp. K2T2]
MANLPTEKISPENDRHPNRPLLWRVLLRTFNGFFDHDVLSLSASLSFYTLLSFAPLLLLGVWLTSTVGYDVRQTLLDQIGKLAGSEARTTAAAVYASANQHPSIGTFAGIIGIVVSVVGATTVFAQLQISLNLIWGIRAHPGNAVWGWLHRRVLSVGVIAATVFVMVVSLLVSSLIGMLLPLKGSVWDVLNQVISTAVLAVLFALLFRYLPDARLPWRRVTWGGGVTALLFALGKWVIGIYLSSDNIGGAYGAAGSLVVLLVWVYYSGAIFFFGAEVVHAWALERGDYVQLSQHTERRD